MSQFFGRRVRALRQARGLQMRAVAAALAISPGLLSRIERGVAEPDDEVLGRIAAYFGDRGEELLLAAGRLPADLQAILQQHPAESALLLREHFAAPPPRARAAPAPFVPGELVSAVAEWAIRSLADVVLDPACGDGAFLAAAGARLLALGAAPAAVANQLHGYDADPEACARTVGRLHQLTGSPSRGVRCDHFLAVEPRARLPFHRSGPPAVSAVIGALAGDGRTAGAAQRQQACRVAAEAGIALPERAAPWAGLLVHAASFVRPDGRLALIVPAVVLHARYAAAVRAYLAQLFPALTVVSFERLLPGAGEVVVLLGDGAGTAQVRALRVADAAGFRAAIATADDSAPAAPAVAEAPVRRWSGASLPTAGLDVLRSLQRAGALRRLGDLVAIDAGVVTGANGFFVLSAAAAQRLPAEFLRPVLPTAGAAAGLIVRPEDWQALRGAGDRCFLLCIPAGAALDAATRRHLARGERDGVTARATCRRRPRWYSLPPADCPAGLLTYLCPRLPRMLVNEAGVTHTNGLHSVQPRPGVNIAAVVASVMTSVALLGCELLGRHYGNGVLKLEPAEIENLLVPYPAHGAEAAAALLPDADTRWRQGEADAAIALMDHHLLTEHLGFDARVIDEIRRCYRAERDRRHAT